MFVQKHIILHIPESIINYKLNKTSEQSNIFYFY